MLGSRISQSWIERHKHPGLLVSPSSGLTFARASKRRSKKIFFVDTKKHPIITQDIPKQTPPILEGAGAALTLQLCNDRFRIGSD